MTMSDLKSLIRHVPDFPKPGILFYDITTLLQDPAGLRQSVDALSAPFSDQGIELVVGIESRGFIFGSAVADRLGAGFSPVRKPGKLPSTTIRATYDLEYGSDALEIHAEGEREALDRFEHHIGHGPPRSRVDHLQTTDVGATGHDTGFFIR